MNDTQLLTLVTTLVGNFGFPIVITGYLLLRFEKKIEALITTIQDLRQAIGKETDLRQR